MSTGSLSFSPSFQEVPSQPVIFTDEKRRGKRQEAEWKLNSTMNDLLSRYQLVSTIYT